MAGSLTTSKHHRGNAEVASEFSRWLICFARFVPYPSSPSPCPRLIPIGKRELNMHPHGTWLSTSSSTASVQMVEEVNGTDVILSVELGEKVLEEHYISKLDFTWPQMSCVSGFPNRGSRAILVSYRDSENEIQKFALRFLTFDAAESFVVSLKEKLKGLVEARNQKKVETRCEGSLQSNYYPSNENVPRSTEKEQNMVRPLDCYVPVMQPRPEYETEQTLYPRQPELSQISKTSINLPRLEYETGQTLYAPQSELSQIPNKTSIKLPRLEYGTEQTLYTPQPEQSQIPNESSIYLPPSFTTLLSSCFPNSTLDAGQTTVKQDPDLKSQILKYMEDSSFEDMVQKVDQIMDEIGGGRMENREMRRWSNKIYIPPCILEICNVLTSSEHDCWCCFSFDPIKRRKCWLQSLFPDAKQLCFDYCSRHKSNL